MGGGRVVYVTGHTRALCSDGATPPLTLPHPTPPPHPHPTRSSWTKRLITAKDHASVQINVADVDPSTGRYAGSFKTFALCGYIRDKAESDMAFTALVAAAEKK